MYKMKRLISIVAMMCAAFLMVATSALPHHHHDDGNICLILDIGKSSNDNHEHGHNGCDDDCAMNINLVQDASQIGHASKAGLIPQLSAILDWNISIVPEPEISSAPLIYLYIEHAYHGIVGTSCGLRAPPSEA